MIGISISSDVGSANGATAVSMVVAKEQVAMEAAILKIEGKGSDDLLTTLHGEQATPSYQVQVSSITKWSKTRERRFCELASLFAVEEISPVELRELEELQRARRKLKNPRTVDEVLHTYQRHKLEDEVMGAMQRYVRFLKAPYSQKA